MSTNDPMIQRMLLAREERLRACPEINDMLKAYFCGKPKQDHKSERQNKKGGRGK